MSQHFFFLAFSWKCQNYFFAWFMNVYFIRFDTQHDSIMLCFHRWLVFQSNDDTMMTGDYLSVIYNISAKHKNSECIAHTHATLTNSFIQRSSMEYTNISCYIDVVTATARMLGNATIYDIRFYLRKLGSLSRATIKCRNIEWWTCCFWLLLLTSIVRRKKNGRKLAGQR